MIHHLIPIYHAGIYMELTYRPSCERLVLDILEDVHQKGMSHTYSTNTETRLVTLKLHQTNRESCNVVASLAQYATSINLHTYND